MSTPEERAIQFKRVPLDFPFRELADVVVFDCLGRQSLTVFVEEAFVVVFARVWYTRNGGTDAVLYNTTSDARLKENIIDFVDSGKLIDALRPRVFDWKNGDKASQGIIGFIAQKINEASPIFAKIGAVTVGDSNPDEITKQWMRSDSSLIPILVAELKFLRTRVATLEAN